MKKFINAFSIVSILLILLLSFSSCGKDIDDAGNYNDGYSKEEIDITQNGNNTVDSSVRKIIETVNLSVQTKEFDVLLQNINDQVINLGGYVESSNVSGREYDSNDTRFATIKVRIPSEKSGDFTNYVSENSVVVNKT